MVRAAIYARVSSAAQRDSHTIDGQLLVLRDFVRRQGWTLTGEYLDDGRSAKTGKLEAREGFARLVRDAAAGCFDVVVIVDVDRLTRTDSIEERAAILGPLQRAGVRIVSPSGGEIDLRTMFGQLDATLRSLYAADENRKRAERVKAGKLRAIAEGRKPAGPTPYGLAYERATGRWSLHPQHAPIMREIVVRVGHGESCVAIADDLADRGIPGPRGKPAWSRHWVWQLVRSTHVYGVWRVDKLQRLEIAVPAIVDRATWQRAQDALMVHGLRGLRKTKHAYLLEGLAVCALCGSPISIRSKTHNRKRTNGNPSPAAYICRARKVHRRGEGRCTLPIVRVAELDDRIWARVAKALAGAELEATIRAKAAARSTTARDFAADVAGYRRHLERLIKIEAGTAARYRRGLLSEAAYDLELAAIARERAAVAQQLEVAHDALARTTGPSETPDALVRQLRELAATGHLADRRTIVRLLAEPGAILDEKGQITMTLVVEEACPRADVGAGLRVVPVVAAGSRTHHENRSDLAIRIRVVA